MLPPQPSHPGWSKEFSPAEGGFSDSVLPRVMAQSGTLQMLISDKGSLKVGPYFSWSLG